MILGKTETIKKRSIWVYVPTLEQRKQWEKIAEKKDISLSKWIVQTVENSLLTIDNEVRSKKDIEKENKDLRNEISNLRKELREINSIREKLETDIKKYRAEPFLTTSFQGTRKYDKELIDIIKNARGVDGKRRYIDNDEILSSLGVKLSEIEAVKSIAVQLSNLENYDLVESSTKGWRWKE